MRQLKRRIATSLFCDYDKSLFWHAFCVAFFGLLREFTCPYPDARIPQRTLLGSSVKLDTHIVSLHLQSSERDQYAYVSVITLKSTSRSLCPVEACNAFAFARLKRGHLDQPFFILFSGKFLTRLNFVNTTVHLLKTLLDYKQFSGHNFRIRGGGYSCCGK